MRSNTAFNYPNILKPSSQVPPFPFHYSPRDEHGAPNLREDFQIGKKKKKHCQLAHQSRQIITKMIQKRTPGEKKVRRKKSSSTPHII